MINPDISVQKPSEVRSSINSNSKYTLQLRNFCCWCSWVKLTTNVFISSLSSHRRFNNIKCTHSGLKSSHHEKKIFLRMYSHLCVYVYTKTHQCIITRSSYQLFPCDFLHFIRSHYLIILLYFRVRCILKEVLRLTILLNPVY